MELPDEEQLKSSYCAFWEATSNKALETRVCVVCAREKENMDGQKWTLMDVPNIQTCLVPHREHPAQEKWEGLLLLRNYIQGEGAMATGWICFECTTALAKDQVPKLALANGMWIGPIPHELSILMIPEQILIACHHLRCFVFKMYPWDCDVHLPPNQLQSSFSGNVSLYKLNTNTVVKMLEGQLMPHKGVTLASVVTITFVGSKKVPQNWLKSTFRVCRHAVYEALRWLRTNNPLYADINISIEQLSDLPEDGVPKEILAIIHHESDMGLTDKEKEGYVPSFEPEMGVVDDEENVDDCDMEDDVASAGLLLHLKVNVSAMINIVSSTF